MPATYMIILAANDEMSKAGFTFYNNCNEVNSLIP